MEQETFDDVEFIDTEAWIPKGEDVIPSIQLKNKSTILDGSRYKTVDTPVIDKLHDAGLIDASHHGVALRLVNLYRLATNKQAYAANTIFSGGYGGSVNSDFCAMTVFIRLTRNLRDKELFWVSIICGVVSRPYMLVARNVHHIKSVLELLEANFNHAQETSEESFHDDLLSK